MLVEAKGFVLVIKCGESLAKLICWVVLLTFREEVDGIANM